MHITNHSNVIVSVKFLFGLIKTVRVFFLMLKVVAIIIGLEVLKRKSIGYTPFQ